MLSKLIPIFCAAMLSHASAAPVPYGSNPAVGKTFVHDGVKLYYEVYGTCEPVLVIHGNGGSIASMTGQIIYFQKHYQVIAMDSRDQGKSADSPDNITYEKMADDLAALLDHLKSPPVYALGWSDGGIEALLLGIRHPDKVKKIASMAANINPQGVYPDTEELGKMLSNVLPPSAKDSPEAKRQMKVSHMMQDEPNIAPQTLETITAPTLIMASDHDLIRDEHTLEIYHHIPNSQLCIFPNATHMIPIDDPELFNSTVDRFFRTPFVKKDRIKDLIKTVEKMMAASKP